MSLPHKVQNFADFLERIPGCYQRFSFRFHVFGSKPAGCFALVSNLLMQIELHFGCRRKRKRCNGKQQSSMITIAAQFSPITGFRKLDWTACNSLGLRLLNHRAPMCLINLTVVSNTQGSLSISIQFLQEIKLKARSNFPPSGENLGEVSETGVSIASRPSSILPNQTGITSCGRHLQFYADILCYASDQF